MRLPFFTPPSGEELASLTLHELLRDYPELWELLNVEVERGGEEGWKLLPDSLREEATVLLAWRETSPR